MSEENTLRANERLREERLRRGWSQQKVADQLGIAVVTVNRWERGKQQPTGYYRLKLSALFEKSEEQLGLVEGTTGSEALTYAEEQQESVRETASVPQGEQKELASVPSHSYDAVLHRPSLEEEVSHLSSFSPYARPGIPLLHRKRRTMLLLLTLILIIVAAPITFLLVRSSFTTAKTSSHPHIATSPSPKQNAEHLVLYDPLTKAGGGTQWGDNNGKLCYFAQNALHITTTGPNYCSADFNSFTDMKFQIDMSIQQGIWSGIILRADGDSNMYYFSISVNGHYEVDALVPRKPSRVILLSNSSSAIHAGYNQTNTLMAEAKQSQLYFWVNGHMVGQTHETTLTDGYVGICGGSFDQSTFSTVVRATYQNAYIWAL